MSAKVLDGKAVAEELLAAVAAKAAKVVASLGRPPGLAVVRVGDDPASKVYVNNKRRTAERHGIRSEVHALPETTGRDELVGRLHALNDDPEVDGVLVQLPLPSHLDEGDIVEQVAPDKDVDGFHPVNVGRLWTDQSGFIACTPRGVMHLLRHAGVSLEGKHAVVIGRSNIVGKPMAALLLAAHATVTVCHSRTRHLPELCRQADVLVAAVGRPRFVQGDWIRPGATVIDVGINRLKDGTLAGDVDFDAARTVAGHITPVPGGVGPMTVAMLMMNTVEAAGRRGFE